MESLGLLDLNIFNSTLGGMILLKTCTYTYFLSLYFIDRELELAHNEDHVINVIIHRLFGLFFFNCLTIFNKNGSFIGFSSVSLCAMSFGILGLRNRILKS